MVRGSGPIVADKLAGRITFGTTTRGGVLYNTTKDEYVNNYRNLDVRAQLLWTPTGAFKMRLISDYSNQRTIAAIRSSLGSSPRQITRASSHWRKRSATRRSSIRTIVRRLATRRSTPIRKRAGCRAEEDWSLPSFTITSISSWRFWNWWPANDADYTPIPVLNVAQNGDYQQQWTQELRIASTGGHRIDYVGGVFAFYEHVKALGETQYGAASTAFLLSPALPSLVTNGYTRNTYPIYKTTSLAAFGQATWHITSKLSLTGGLRYTTTRRTAISPR